MKRRLFRIWAHLPRPVRRRLVRLGTPSHTVGAIAVIERDGEVLLVRLAYRGGWGLPGGLLKRKEQPSDAVRREVVEEVGLDVEVLGVPTVVVETDVRRVDVVYRCRFPDGADPGSVRATSDEIVEVRWWPLDELPDLQPEAAAAIRVSRMLNP